MVLFNMTTLPTLLRNYDRFSMRSSGGRSPFLDYRLVELTLNAPEKFKYRNGKNKNILREAMKGILNEEDRTKLKKIGFNSDMNKILRGNIGQELLSYLNMKKNLNHRQIIDLKNFLSNKKNDHLKANQIWNSIYLNLWDQQLRIICMSEIPILLNVFIEIHISEIISSLHNQGQKIYISVDGPRNKDDVILIKDYTN